MSLRTALAGRYDILANLIDVDHGLWLTLRDNDVLPFRHIKDCQQQTTEFAKVSKLLELLETRDAVDDTSFGKFCKALTDNGQAHVVRLLRQPLNDVDRRQPLIDDEDLHGPTEVVDQNEPQQVSEEARGNDGHSDMESVMDTAPDVSLRNDDNRNRTLHAAVATPAPTVVSIVPDVAVDRDDLAEVELVADVTSERTSDELTEVFRRLSLTVSDGGRHPVSVHRDRMMEEMLQLYGNDASLPLRRVRVRFVGESGIDHGGLTKDLYTSLWARLLEQYFRGQSAVVPYLPLHRDFEQRPHFTAIGRVLAHTVALLNTIPARLSRCTVICLALGPAQVSDELLLSDFSLYVNDEDRWLLGKALTNFNGLSSQEKDSLLSLFGTFGMFAMPNERNIRQLVLSVARNQLLDLPMPLIEAMRLGTPDVHRDMFWSMLTVPIIDVLFQQQLPTPAKVRSVIRATEEHLRQEQQNCMYYLQQFVGHLDQDDLGTFLHFVTGSSSMPDRILVSFNTLAGELRRPIAHTCSNTLELSSTYGSTHELKREFMTVLRDPMCFQMHML